MELFFLIAGILVMVSGIGIFFQLNMTKKINRCFQDIAHQLDLAFAPTIFFSPKLKGEYKGYQVEVDIQSQGTQYNNFKIFNVTLFYSVPEVFHILPEKPIHKLGKFFINNELQINMENFDKNMYISGNYCDLIMLLSNQTRNFLNRVNNVTEHFSFSNLQMIMEFREIHTLKAIKSLVEETIFCIEKLKQTTDKTQSFIADLTYESDENYKTRVIETLLNFPCSEDIQKEKIFKALLNDTSEKVKIYAAAALGGEGLVHLLECNKEELSVPDKVLLIKKLSAFSTQKVQKVILDSLESIHDEIVLTSIQALVIFPDKKTATALNKTAVKHSDSRLILNAIKKTMTYIKSQLPGIDTGWLSVADQSDEGALGFPDED